MKKEILAHLNKYSVQFKLHQHQPVRTCDEAKIHCAHIPGANCKNLFLRESATKNFYLVIVQADKKLDMKDLAKCLEIKKLTFANKQQLQDKLGCKPGSVSPLSLVSNTERDISVIIDKEIWGSELLNFHPGRNDESLEIDKENFHKFIKSLAITPRLMVF